eukprot:TRINITY_DN324_c1_g1_i3.p1 TRINITY_DN324_c1_g1~~TRINITY_DN324_c1_g1_i3.p1  ORF type:complete len:809 (+),score=280.92 TRINITY_DN324_c1_g1_i3:437-2863(+)
METVLRPPLEQLVKKASGKKHIALRQACADVLEVLSGDMGKVDETGCANAVVRPLLMGLETDNTRIVRVALEGIHSLISEGYLASFPMEDDFHGEEESELLSDRVIQLVCACFSIRDDVVENLVLKILMAAMISETFSLHGGSLLGAVRTCYNVHLVSKNVDNQIFAKAVILQTVRIVLARLDMQYKADHPELQKESENESTDESGKEVYEEEEENPIAEPGDAAKSPPPPKSFLTSEAEIEKVVNEEHEESHEEFANILERDVFLLFRAFCKLSMKKITEDEGPDGMALRCRILSLEMLLFGLNDPQDSLTRSSTFSILIKKYLCISLLKNSVSTVPAIFRLSVSVLLSAMSSFRSLLKEEISIFFTSVFLRILQSAHSPFTHKIIAIHALHEICRNPQALVELFVNFDCDVHEVNIYERMINALCKVVGSTQTEVSSFNDQQRMILRLTAMHCLVTVLRSSREWMDSRLGLASVKKEMDDETVDDDDDDDDDEADDDDDGDEYVDENGEHLPKKRKNARPSKKYVDEDEDEEFEEESVQEDHPSDDDYENEDDEAELEDDEDIDDDDEFVPDEEIEAPDEEEFDDDEHDYGKKKRSSGSGAGMVHEWHTTMGGALAGSSAASTAAAQLRLQQQIQMQMQLQMQMQMQMQQLFPPSMPRSAVEQAMAAMAMSMTSSQTAGRVPGLHMRPEFLQGFGHSSSVASQPQPQPQPQPVPYPAAGRLHFHSMVPRDSQPHSLYPPSLALAQSTVRAMPTAPQQGVSFPQSSMHIPGSVAMPTAMAGQTHHAPPPASDVTAPTQPTTDAPPQP